MKNLARFATLPLFAVIAISSFSATAAQTNAVQTINVQLTLLTQGPFKTNSPATNDISATVLRTTIATKDVIGWLGTATTNVFSANAKLVRVKHFNATANDTTIEIRDGTNVVDVSAFFSNSYQTNGVQASIYNTVTQVRTGKEFGLLHLELTNAPPYNLVPHFNVFGSETLGYVSLTSGKSVLIADEIRAQTLAGGGAGADGVRGFVTGSVTIRGTVREIK
jgi:hypothetical protein